MSRIKEITDISAKITKKLEAAITQTVNARLFYENYQSLLNEAKSSLQRWKNNQPRARKIARNWGKHEKSVRKIGWSN